MEDRLNWRDMVKIYLVHSWILCLIWACYPKKKVLFYRLPLQEIFDNIETNEDTVTDFHNDSQLLLDPESKLEDTSLTLVNDGVKTVQHDWESLKMRTDALSLRLVLYCPQMLYFSSCSYPVNIYLLKGNNWNTRTRCEICSKLAINTPERRHWRSSDYQWFTNERQNHIHKTEIILPDIFKKTNCRISSNKFPRRLLKFET